MGLTGPVQSNDIVMRASEIGSTIPGIASLAMKSARKGAQRGVQGIYQLPSGEEPTPEYMNVAQQGLNNQTRQMADMLNSMAPEDEQLAYINEEEAGILKLLGGSGTTENNPAGIPSFMGHHGDSKSGQGMKDSKGNERGGGRERERQKQAEAAAEAEANEKAEKAKRDMQKSIAEAEQKEQDRQRREESANAGNEMSELDKMAEAEDNVNKENVDKYNSQEQIDRRERDREIMDAGADIKTGDPFDGYLKDSQGNLVAAGGALRDYRQDQADKKAREAFAQRLEEQAAVSAMDPQERSMMSTFGRSIGEQADLGGYRVDSEARLSDMSDRRAALTELAKKDNITNDQLNELANLNRFEGFDPTVGMGGIESLRYQVSNPQFGEDLGNLGNILGVVSGNPLSIAKGLYDLFPGQIESALGPKKAKSSLTFKDGYAQFGEKASKSKNPFTIKGALNRFSKNNLGDQIGEYGQSLKDKAKDQFAGYFKNQNVANDGSTIYTDLSDDYGKRSSIRGNLPDTYRGGKRSDGTSIYDKGQGEDRREEAARAEMAEAEEEEQIKRDRFERAFAQRYFTGPANLDQVRRYATVGGYNQLTPFSGREV